MRSSKNLLLHENKNTSKTGQRNFPELWKLTKGFQQSKEHYSKTKAKTQPTLIACSRLCGILTCSVCIALSQICVSFENHQPHNRKDQQPSSLRGWKRIRSFPEAPFPNNCHI